jgi:DNA-binding transcriptional LysR family regulator
MNDVHFDTLDLNLLRVLGAILEERSVTRAGARLGITQSAVSHALNRLRAALGDPLVVRTPTGMHPTARGAEIGAGLPAAFEHLLGALSASAFNPQTSQRAFTIVTGPYACAVVLPALVARVLREAPSVRIQIRGYSSDMIDRFDRGEADILIAGFGAPPAHLHQERMFDESFVWVVRARHPLARQEVTFAALAAVPHVVIDNPQSGFDPHEAVRVGAGIDQGAFQRELQKRRLKQQIGLVVPDTQSALAVVSQTDMAALIPRRLALMRPPIGALSVLTPPYASPSLAIGFMARPDRLEAADMAWLADHLRAVSAALA